MAIGRALRGPRGQSNVALIGSVVIAVVFGLDAIASSSGLMQALWGGTAILFLGVGLTRLLWRSRRDGPATEPPLPARRVS